MSLVSLSKVQSVMSEAAPLPSPIWAAVKGFGYVHWLWRWNKKRELYQEPDNWLMLLAGHGANYCISNPFIRGSAHVLLVATKIDAHVQEALVFSEELTSLNHAIKGYYIPYNWTFKDRLNRIKLIASRVFQSFFRLTMNSIEVYDSLYRTDEAMNEVFINGAKWVERLVNNKQELVDGLRKMEKVVNQILSQWHVKVDAKVLIKHFERVIDVADHSLKKVKKTNKYVGGVLKSFVLNPAVAWFHD